MASSYDDPEITVVAPPTPQSPQPDSLKNVTALARFEFEPGQGNNGTKILMVVWDDEDPSRHKKGSWHVSWQGKNSVFTIENTLEETQRLYFLLPPGSIVPPHITIAYQPAPPQDGSGSAADGAEGLLKMTVNPLPAIFTPELGATAKASGKKGVLHTIWAKKRLQSLDREIQQEEGTNLEGIALEMAKAEKQWIENNFGISSHNPKPPMLDMSGLGTNSSNAALSPGLQSPRSPGGGRLTQKLKGLSIGTTDKDLAGTRGVNTPTRESHPLSPETGDMAYSSFSAFRDKPPSQQPRPAARVVAESPPEHIRQEQAQQIGSSLDFVLSNPPKPAARAGVKNEADKADTDAEDLFAVALSPRSPDDPKSPFSIPSSEVGAFAKIKGLQQS